MRHPRPRSLAIVAVALSFAAVPAAANARIEPLGSHRADRASPAASLPTQRADGGVVRRPAVRPSGVPASGDMLDRRDMAAARAARPGGVPASGDMLDRREAAAARPSGAPASGDMLDRRDVAGSRASQPVAAADPSETDWRVVLGGAAAVLAAALLALWLGANLMARRNAARVARPVAPRR